MIRSARAKIANKVAKIEVTDDFHFAKWLRAPVIITPEVRAVDYSEVIEGINVGELKVPTALKLKFRFDIPNHLPHIRQKYKLDKPKAYLIFFGLTRPQLFTMKENLLSYPQLTDFKSEMPQIPDVIDQSSVFITKPVPSYDQSSVFILKTSYSSDQSSVSSIQTVVSYDQNLNFANVSIREITLLITPPKISSELANLVPEVYNIELLNVEKFDPTLVNYREYKIEYFAEPQIVKINVPDIDNIVNSTTTSINVPFEEIPQADVKFYSPTFEMAHQIFKVKIDLPKTVVKKVIVKQKNFEPVVMDALNDDRFSESLKSEIKYLLSSFREISWEEYSKTIKGLDAYQLQSASFLASNKFALLSDELGYEKYEQASAAISFLVKKGTVKSVLLISERNRFNEYWSSSFKTFVKELKVKKIEPGATKKVKRSSIWFLDINDIGKIELKDFDKIDLVLFDELVNIKSASAQIDSLINKIEPNFIWFLTAIRNEKYNKKFLQEFVFTQQVEFNSFGKSLSEIQGDEQVALIKNIWLELDEMQLFEYSEAMEQAKEELNILSDSVNPLKFQSNIFNIIHKLKQILNFSSFRNISPKANLLIEQLEAAHRNKKNAIVFTQYDVNGMKKLEKVLEMNNIKFVVGRNGMSTEELKRSLDTFYDRREVTVFLTNLKASRLKINLSKVQYIFNFDQWWNPATIWQNDDETGVNEIVHSPIIVYNYHIKNTFEEELQKVIAEKGFDNRYLFDNLKSETISELISLDDWLAIFRMNDQYKKLLNAEAK